MSSVNRPRGPLPARVYWTRRLALVVLAGALVLGLGHLLGSAPDSAAGMPTARQAAAGVSTPTGPTPARDQGRSAHRGSHRHAQSRSDHPRGTSTGSGKAKHTLPPLPEPTGPCRADDITAQPAVKHAAAGQDVTVRLLLSTTESAACTWEVSSDSLVLKITSGSDRIWSSQDCPGAVPDTSVVVRRAEPTRVDVDWPEARRSQAGCAGGTEWAEPGYYHATAAALGGDPADAQFQLVYPRRPVVTKTAKPKPERRASKESSPAPGGQESTD